MSTTQDPSPSRLPDPPATDPSSSSDIRGQFFVDDEVLSSGGGGGGGSGGGSGSSSGGGSGTVVAAASPSTSAMPVSTAPPANPSSSSTSSPFSSSPSFAAKTSPAGSRRKQTKPLKMEVTDSVTEFTSDQQGAGARKAAESDSDSDRGLVIDTGSPTAPKKETGRKEKLVEHAQKKRRSSSDASSPAKKQSSSSLVSSSAASAKKAKKEGGAKAEKKPPKVTGGGGGGGGGGGADDDDDDVENAMEALFAGVEESKGADAAKGSASKKKAPDVASATPKAATTNTNTNTNTTASKEKTKAKKKKEAPSSGKSKSKPAEPPTEKKRSKKVSKPTLKEAKAVAERRRSQHGFDPDRLSPQEKLLMKFDGPFIHVEGDPSSPRWSGVVNSPLDRMKPGDKYKGGKRSQNRQHAPGIDDREMQKRAAAAEFGPTSTLGSLYDARKPDTSWVCIFCQRSSHYHGLGDLFGPYFVTSESARCAVAAVAAASADKASAAAKSLILGGDSAKKRRKRKPSSLEGSPAKGGEKAAVEIWFHEDCVCWMPDVTLIGTRLIGLDEAVVNASGAYCNRCRNMGSTMACLRPGCKEMSHFVCAKTARWKVSEETFEAYCTKHAS